MRTAERIISLLLITGGLFLFQYAFYARDPLITFFEGGCTIILGAFFWPESAKREQKRKSREQQEKRQKEEEERHQNEEKKRNFDDMQKEAALASIKVEPDGITNLAKQVVDELRRDQL